MRITFRDRRNFLPRRNPAALLVGLLIWVAGLWCLLTGKAFAVEFGAGNTDLKLRWDNTVTYSAAARVSKRSDAHVTKDLAANRNTTNLDHGDRNFGRGLISNRLDLLSDSDLNYQGRFGARVNGAAWYDSVYDRLNDNDALRLANQSSVANNEFTDATRKLHGRKAETLDTVVFANDDIADRQAGGRLGKHTLLPALAHFLLRPSAPAQQASGTTSTAQAAAS